jgi:hypothetical protein
MRRLVFAICGALTFGAFAAEETSPKTLNVALDARAVHEECMTLGDGAKRNYSWKASGPVDFNVHYHQGPEVFYPVKRDGMRGDGGTFIAKTAQDYCWMWTARDKPVKLEGRIENK